MLNSKDFSYAYEETFATLPGYKAIQNADSITHFIKTYVHDQHVATGNSAQ